MEWDKESVVKSKHFCVAPWVHVHLWPDSSVFPCCVADSSKPFGKLENSFEEVLNNKKYSEFRNKCKNDEASDICSKCYKVEELKTGLSLRQTLNRDYAVAALPEINSTNDDGTCEEYKLTYWDFRSSNLCNLSCRTCGPQLSSAWAQDSNKIHGSDYTKIIKINADVKEVVSVAVENHVEHVKEIYFAGGEPLIMPEHLDVLNMLIAKNNTDVHIRYSTNAMKLEYKGVSFVDVWPLFSRVTIVVSLDEVESRSEYWRNGTQWPTLLKNLKIISELARKHDNIEFWISPTVSCFNAFRLLDMHKFLLENDLLDDKVEMIYNILHDPDYYCIRNQKAEFKEYTLNKLNEYLNWLKIDAPKWHINQRLIATINGLIDFAKDGKDLSTELSRQTAILDVVRTQNIKTVNPELFDIGIDETMYATTLQNWKPKGVK
jgi:hypothetical protein